MSLLRIPFSLSLIWAVYTTLTAPQQVPEAEERVEPIGLEVAAMPSLLKIWSLSLSLAETLTILASMYPSSNLSRDMVAILVRSPSSTPSAIRLTWPFILAWICTMFGAYIRRSCYQAMGRMFTFELSLRKDHQLVTSGPYSVVRHPSYTGGAFALLGTLTCYTSPGS